MYNQNLRQIQLLKMLINSNGFLNSEYVCKKLNISDRTLRSDIKSAEREYRENGIQLISKKGVGYSATIIDEDKCYPYLKKLFEDMETSQKLLPVYAEDRINYLLKLFLINNDYLKTDDVAEELLISKTTISNDLKEVRERLSYFHLELVSKPSYGMKLIGKEIHRRSCIAQYFFHTETVDDRYFHMESMNETQKKIRDILFEVLNEKQFRLTDIGFQNLIIHISIAIMRNRESTEVDIKDYREIENKKEFDIANLLVSKIEKAFSVRLKQQETYYIAIHLLGKKAIRYNNGYTITNEVEKIMQDIFKEINKNYDIDFSKDFELYTLLALHIQPMMDRLRYGLKVANPLLNEVKEKNSEAFEIAVFTANVIDKSTGFVLDEAEIGYLALHFAL